MTMRPIWFLLLAFLPAHLFATEQIPDTIKYKGETCELETTWEYPSPLVVYFIVSGKKYPFESLHTANWRGHVAAWELTDETLYLLDVRVEEKKIDLNELFPGQFVDGKVKASWFSGLAVVLTGRHKKMLENEHYTFNYKSYVFLRLQEGIVKKRTVLSKSEYTKAWREYWKRERTDNPLTNGIMVEYAEYILSFRKGKGAGAKGGKPKRIP